MHSQPDFQVPVNSVCLSPMSVNWFCKFYLCCQWWNEEKVDLQWIGGFFVSKDRLLAFVFLLRCNIS